jgi:hypothetical protein
MAAQKKQDVWRTFPHFSRFIAETLQKSETKHA